MVCIMKKSIFTLISISHFFFFPKGLIIEIPLNLGTLKVTLPCRPPPWIPAPSKAPPKAAAPKTVVSTRVFPRVEIFVQKFIN